MQRLAVLDAALDLIRAGRAFIFATADEDGFPQVRWMGGHYLEEPLTVYMACDSESRKMRQIASHPEAQLMFQTEGFSRVATLTGTAKVVTEPSVRRKVYAGIPGASQYFPQGPDDARFGSSSSCAAGSRCLARGGMAPVAADI